MRRSLPTAPIAAAGLVCGYAVAVASGSRPLGGLVLLAFGLGVRLDLAQPRQRSRHRDAGRGGGGGIRALSHVVALAIGAWPAVLLSALVTAAACWRLSDSSRTLRFVINS